MSALLAADYAWARPSLAALKKAGYSAVLRYLSTDPTKNLSTGERDSILNAGLGIGLVWETQSNRAIGGATAGATDGDMAVSQATALGVPPGAMLVANLGDFAATAADIPAIHEYYAAFRRVAGFGYQAGGYATGYIIDELVKAGAIGLWWQNAMNDSGSLGSVVSPNASMYQRVTPTVGVPGVKAGDIDENVYGFGPATPNFWVSQPASPPPPPPPITLSALLVRPTLATSIVHSIDGGANWH